MSYELKFVFFCDKDSFPPFIVAVQRSTCASFFFFEMGSPAGSEDVMETAGENQLTFLTRRLQRQIAGVLNHSLMVLLWKWVTLVSLGHVSLYVIKRLNYELQV